MPVGNPHPASPQSGLKHQDPTVYYVVSTAIVQQINTYVDAVKLRLSVCILRLWHQPAAAITWMTLHQKI